MFALRRLVVPLSWGWEFETCKMRREREREMVVVVMGKMEKSDDSGSIGYGEQSHLSGAIRGIYVDMH